MVSLLAIPRFSGLGGLWFLKVLCKSYAKSLQVMQPQCPCWCYMSLYIIFRNIVIFNILKNVKCCRTEESESLTIHLVYRNMWAEICAKNMLTVSSVCMCVFVRKSVGFSRAGGLNSLIPMLASQLAIGPTLVISLLQVWEEKGSREAIAGGDRICCMLLVQDLPL